jgi:cobalt-zinc-cadmium efflux system protein
MVAGVGMVVMGVQFVAGYLANSLVLWADAVHYLTDVGAILLAFAASALSTRPASRTKTFGYQRSEVLAAFLNAIFLWILSAWLIYESVQRLRAPQDVDGRLVAIVAAGSLVVNALLAWSLQRGAAINLNMRAAYLHILSDVLGSAAALGAGLAIHFYGFNVADPLLTLFVTALVLLFTFRLTRQTLHILMEGTPRHIEVMEIAKELREMPGVSSVHDLHVWTLTPGIESLSVHVVLDAKPASDDLTHTIRQLLRQRFRIDHVTVQLEDPDCPCDEARHPLPSGHL